MSLQTTPLPIKRCSIITVHGTWGRGIFPSDDLYSPRWFDIESQFCREIRLALQDQGISPFFRPFLWSGANSIFERDQAAHQLGAVIRDEQRQSHTDFIVLICHSHGGNVALRALELTNIDPKSVLVVTLSTPFLIINKRKSESFLLLCFFLICANAIFLLNTLKVIPIIGYMLCVALSSILCFRVILGLSRDGFMCRRAQRIAEASRYGNIGDHLTRMLVIRGVDDEASYALHFGGMFARLSYFFVAEWVPAMFFRFLILFSIGWFLSDWPNVTQLYFTYILAIYGLGAVLLAGIFKSFLGRELWIGCAGCEVAVDSSPDAKGNLDVVTLVNAAEYKIYPFNIGGLLQRFLNQIKSIKKIIPVVGGLRHSIYEDNRSMKVISDWIGANSTLPASKHVSTPPGRD